MCDVITGYLRLFTDDIICINYLHVRINDTSRVTSKILSM